MCLHRYKCHIRTNELHVTKLQECENRDGTLTLEEVWRPKKSYTELGTKKKSKYFVPTKINQITTKVKLIIGLSKLVSFTNIF